MIDRILNKATWAALIAIAAIDVALTGGIAYLWWVNQVGAVR